LRFLKNEGKCNHCELFTNQIKKMLGELGMTKEQLVRMAAKLGLKQGNPKAEDILKIVLDESYKEKPNT